MKSKYIPNRGNKKPKSSLVRSVLEVFESKPDKPLNYKQICNVLKITSAHSRKSVIEVLLKLASEKQIKEVSRGKYYLDTPVATETGTIDFATSGSGFVTIDGQVKDVFIHSRNTLNALNGDLVSIKITKQGRGKRPEGKVVKVLERRKMDFVGTLEINDRYAFVVADDRKIHTDFFVTLDKINKARDGEKVLIRMTDWNDPKQSPSAEVIESLGMPGENDVEMLSILANKGFTTTFPKSVIREAEAISLEIAPEEIKSRRDFRKVLTFTIDPVDAKDFDDALSFNKIDENTFEIGVHIADVTHYIKPDSALDQEALKRATSVYLVDRVIPMLPERLSNGVCSLRPNEDKLCFATVFKMNTEGEVLDTWIGRTVIHSDKRFTYEDVQEILEAKQGLYADELLLLDKIAKVLRAHRMKEGSISFNKVEVRFSLDENNNPAGVYFKEQKDAHQLIEDFMLLANKSVALYVSKLQQKFKPFIYRVHDDPDPEKIATLGQFIKRFGYSLDQEKLQSSLNSILQKAQGRAESSLIETLAIRTMAKAIYTTYNIGHYGLGFSHYSHFTSPIRRYPDVIAHRLLWKYLNDKKPESQEAIEPLCKHSSDMERAAIEAERESTKYFQALLLSDKVGEIFDGVISGVSDFGIFVEINENKCEGMIRLTNMKDDYYSFDENNYCVVGNNSGKIYQLGQDVTIRVNDVNLAKKQMDFELID